MGIPNIVLPSKDNIEYLVGDPTYSNQISITIQYRLKISNEPDQITVQFI